MLAGLHHKDGLKVCLSTDSESEKFLPMKETTRSRALWNVSRNRLRERYDRLWSASIEKIRTGNIELDPVLEARTPDRRRGLTVIARPAAAVQQRVAAFLRELRHLEPNQYYYPASEFHLTVLSLFTATVNHAPFLTQTESYVAAVDSALRKVGPFRIEFEGITTSPGAVVIQGFPANGALNDLREILREQLQVRQLAKGLDRRYRLETAHITVARFRVPLCDGKRLAAALERARRRPFGATNIGNLSLVKNDWYMTHQVLETVKRYRLPIRW
jgi:2'-5' RNA ligase